VQQRQAVIDGLDGGQGPWLETAGARELIDVRLRGRRLRLHFRDELVERRPVVTEHPESRQQQEDDHQVGDPGPPTADQECQPPDDEDDDRRTAGGPDAMGRVCSVDQVSEGACEQDHDPGGDRETPRALFFDCLHRMNGRGDRREATARQR
jgi:hypothetical protein